MHERLVVDTADVALRMAGRTGAVRARRWLTLGDGRSESPLETRLRLLLVDAGIPPEQLQWPVRVDGRVIARLDFAWPSRRVCVEADGVAFHRGENAILRDRHRQNDVVAIGWILLRFTWADVVGRSDEVAGAVARALSHSPRSSPPPVHRNTRHSQEPAS